MRKQTAHTRKGNIESLTLLISRHPIELLSGGGHDLRVRSGDRDHGNDEEHDKFRPHKDLVLRRMLFGVLTLPMEHRINLIVC